MVKEQISIIVPICNAEACVRRCVDSILAQTYNNFELILIDDGSTDSSPGVCDEYARKDRRVTVLHKENGGVSSARNQGLKIAAGEYIAFIDPEDWVHPQYLEVLLTVLKKHGGPLSVCGFECVRTYFMGGPVAADKAAVVLLDAQGISGFRHIRSCVWGKLFKAAALQGLRFRSGPGEAAFSAEFLLHPNQGKAAFTPLALYYRSHRPADSIPAVCMPSSFIRIEGA